VATTSKIPDIALHQGIFFALQEAEHVEDPYPLYERLRSTSPVHWDFVLCGWFLTRYADVKAALVDPRLTTRNFPWDVSQLPPDLQAKLAPLGLVMKKEVLYNDAVEHDRLRRPLNRAFHPTAFAPVRPGMEALADELVARAERRGSMDVVSEYAKPLADHMIAELLGLPVTERTEFIASCDRLSEFVTSRRMGRETILRAEGAVKSFEAITARVHTMVAERLANSAGDVIGRSLQVPDAEAPPTEQEIVANCIFFLHAGARNTAAAISNAIVALMRNPDQLERLRADPRPTTAAVAELLRFDTPVQVAIRGVPEEIEVAGCKVGPKHLLVLLLGAANRDPEHFAEPDRLDVTRRPNRHLAFGVGAHGCVGGWMARFGLGIAIGALLNRRTGLRLATGQLQWHPASLRRTVRALPVLVDPPPRMTPSTRPMRDVGALAGDVR
jgi:cytochrome P450